VNLIEDPLKVVADLQPASLDRLAEEGYARRRAADLARLTADLAKPAKHGRRRVLAACGAGLAAAAVAAVTLTAPSAPGHGHPTGVGTNTGPGTAQVRLAAHTVLLASARLAAHAPAATGTYWYVRERDFEPTGPQKKLSRPAEPPYRASYAATQETWLGLPRPGEPLYRASYAATQETWFGPARTRTIVNEDLAFNFASPADKARWQAAGSPKLANPSGHSGYTGPVASDYNFGGYSCSIGAIQVSLAKARTLPTTATGLGALLRHQWDTLSAKQKAATIGLPNPSYTLYLFQVASALLTGPVTSGTKVAVYELLASQPGLTVAPNVTDPLGRVGTAVGDGAGNYLIIDPATAKVLAETTYPVHPGATIPATAAGTKAYEAMGWTSQLDTPASS
jgi:hypothetical protein